MAMRGRSASGGVVPSRRTPVATAAGRVYQDFKPVFEWSQQDGDADILVVYLPGYVKEYIKVTTENRNIVRIRGERPLEGNKWSRFQEDFQVPKYCDMRGIRAKFEGGVLAVTMPKKIIAATDIPTVTSTTVVPPKIVDGPRRAKQGESPRLPMPRNNQENGVPPLPPKPTAASTSVMEEQEKHEKLATKPPPPGSDHQNTPRVFVSTEIEKAYPKRTTKGVEKDYPKLTPKGGSDDQDTPRESVSTSSFADGEKRKDDIKRSPPKDDEEEDGGIIPRVFVSPTPVKNIDAEEGKDRKTEKKKPSEAAAMSQNTEISSNTENKGKEPMHAEKVVDSIADQNTANKQRLSFDGLKKTTKNITNMVTGSSVVPGDKLESYMTKMVKGIANAAKGRNEERELLVNMGVAVLVIVALGTYVSYTVGSSSSRKTG